MSDRRHYTGRDVAILVPTKDRPEKVRDLLESLARQIEPCGRILLIDGGDDLEEIVTQYQSQLPVERYVCRPPGQIRQRNLGISLLDDRTPLIACLDDDIVLEEEALSQIVEFWNRCDADTAGVGFNIVNTPPEPRSWLRDLFGLSGPVPGRVLRSGCATSTCQAMHDVRVQWLCGGATTWRLDVLRQYSHRDIVSKWAIAEDLIFSYPIGRVRSLFVCASARVRHEHVFDYRVPRQHRFHGYTQTVWMFHFVESHRELSRARFLWMIGGTVIGRILAAIVRRERRHWDFACGQLEGAWRGLRAIRAGHDLTELMKDPT